MASAKATSAAHAYTRTPHATLPLPAHLLPACLNFLPALPACCSHSANVTTKFGRFTHHCLCRAPPLIASHAPHHFCRHLHCLTLPALCARAHTTPGRLQGVGTSALSSHTRKAAAHRLPPRAQLGTIAARRAINKRVLRADMRLPRKPLPHNLTHAFTLRLSPHLACTPPYHTALPPPPLFRAGRKLDERLPYPHSHTHHTRNRRDAGALLRTWLRSWQNRAASRYIAGRDVLTQGTRSTPPSRLTHTRICLSHCCGPAPRHALYFTACARTCSPRRILTRARNTLYACRCHPPSTCYSFLYLHILSPLPRHTTATTAPLACHAPLRAKLLAHSGLRCLLPPAAAAAPPSRALVHISLRLDAWTWTVGRTLYHTTAARRANVGIDVDGCFAR